MNRIEEEFIKRFRNQESHKDLDKDDLWDGIESGLNNPPPIPAKGLFSKGFFFNTIIVSTVAVLLVLLTLFVLSPSSEEVNTQIAKEVITSKNEQLLLSYDKKSAKSIDLDIPIYEKKEIIPNFRYDIVLKEKERGFALNAENSNKISGIFGTTNPKNIIQQKYNASFLENKALKNIVQSKSTQSFFAESLALKRTTTSKTSGTDYFAQQRDQKNNVSEVVVVENLTPNLPAVSTSKNLFPSENETTSSLVSEILLLPIPTRNISNFSFPTTENYPLTNWQPSKWVFGLTSGINSTSFNYKSTNSTTENVLATVKNESESERIGYSINMNLSYLLNNTWQIRSGVRYIESRTIFTYENTEIVQELKTNVLLRVFIDQNTGEEINTIIGDTLIDVAYTRSVSHRNSLNIISIPLEFGLKKDLRLWQFGITGGINFNFIGSYSGKFLDDNQKVIEYSNTNANKVFKNFHVGFGLSPYIAYKLNRQLSLNINPIFTYHANFLKNTDNIKLNTKIYQLHLGFLYNL